MFLLVCAMGGHTFAFQIAPREHCSGLFRITLVCHVYELPAFSRVSLRFQFFVCSSTNAFKSKNMNMHALVVKWMALGLSECASPQSN